MTTELTRVSARLATRTRDMSFSSPVVYTYHPLDYARAAHETYLTRFGATPKEVLLVGMNPGPFGMAQTGVPFGEVTHVRDWLGVHDDVTSPSRVHPKRPVEGFSTRRSEVSGARVWGWARSRFVTPEKFFEQFFVVNYCPLLFLSETGSNLTPDKLVAEEREPLLAVCDDALREVVEVLKPRIVLGVGTWAESRAQVALANVDVKISRILHPSPASPSANRGWAERAEQDLRAAGVVLRA